MFFGVKDEIIRRQDQQIKELKLEVTRERQRAELAVDELLRSKGVPSVMPEKARLMPLEDPAEIAKRRKEMERVRAELELVGDLGPQDPPQDEKLAA